MPTIKVPRVVNAQSCSYRLPDPPPPLSAVLIKVFDGNCSLRRRMFRTIAVSRSAATDAILSTALAAFHIGSKSGQSGVGGVAGRRS